MNARPPRCYSYPHHFPGHRPHCILAACATLQERLDSCEPRREFVWEEASDVDENAMLVSRGFKENSVAWRMANLSLGELAAQRAAANAAQELT